jgi:hypothetical protein
MRCGWPPGSALAPVCGKPGDTAYVVETYDPTLGSWPDLRQRAVLVLCREHDPLAQPQRPAQAGAEPADLDA